MARKQVFGVGLLPSRRAVRVVRLDARRTLELSRRVGEKLMPPAEPGAPGKQPSQSAISIEMNKETVALCVRAITLVPLEVKTSQRPATDAEKAARKAATGEDITIVDEVDFEATLGALRDNPKDPRWTPLGEQQLANDHEDNDLGMFELFSDPADWRAVTEIIGAAGGGGLSVNPFAGKVLKTSAG